MTDQKHVDAADWRTALRDARSQLAQAKEWTAGVHAAQSFALADLETAIEGVLQEGINALPGPTVPPTAHRRAHRPGVMAKLDADPEVRAFVTARLDRLTFNEIATEVAAHFPPARHVGKSAIHDWWQKRQKRMKSGHPG